MGDEADRGTEGRDGDAIVGEAELVEADFAAAAKMLGPSKPVWLWAALVFGFWGIANSLGASIPSATVLFPVVFVIVLLLLFGSSGRKNWVKRAIADAGGPTEFRFDAFGVGSSSQVRQLRCAWSTLLRFVETGAAATATTNDKARAERGRQ